MIYLYSIPFILINENSLIKWFSRGCTEIAWKKKEVFKYTNNSLKLVEARIWGYVAAL